MDHGTNINLMILKLLCEDGLQPTVIAVVSRVAFTQPGLVVARASIRAVDLAKVSRKALLFDRQHV